MANHVAVLQSADPEVFGEDFEPFTVALEVGDRFLVHCLHVECLDNGGDNENLTLLQFAYHTCLINFLLVKSDDELVDNFAGDI